MDLNIQGILSIISIDQSCKLFLKTYNLKTNRLETSFPISNYYLRLSDANQFNDEFKHYLKCEFPYSIISNLDVIRIHEFQSLSDGNYYLKISNQNSFHIHINKEGKVIRSLLDDISTRYHNSERDFVIFDTESFEELALYDFFDEMFDYDDFHYHRIMNEYVYNLFISADKKRIGIFYFCKDYDSPRGNYSFFDSSDLNNLKLIFSQRVDEPHSNHKFKINDNNTIYYFNPYKEVFVISELVNNSLFKKVEISDNLKEELFGYENFYLINDKIVEVLYDRFVIFDSISEAIVQISREIHAPYSFNENKLVYIINGQLKIVEFE